MQQQSSHKYIAKYFSFNTIRIFSHKILHFPMFICRFLKKVDSVWYVY